MTSAYVHRSRRNAAVVGATGLGVVVLFLFPTSTNRTGHLLRQPGVAAASGVVNNPAVPAAPGSTAPQPPVTAVRTINGAAVDTQYGPVQVQVRVRNHRILSATAVIYPQGSDRDQQINSYAIPVLQQEALAAQSSQIDGVSGATYTSEGYIGSLQSALDLAGR